ncbi:MAG: hypothetical protein IJ589_05460, partial [Lachnospiraceae bacterium]|nr:hypothetical protein [Lachnospiraceae bacterium]
MKKFKGIMKAAIALVLAGSMMFTGSFTVQARQYCDGDTPEDIDNSVVGADGVRIHPSIRTTFLTPEIGTLCPITP